MKFVHCYKYHVQMFRWLYLLRWFVFVAVLVVVQASSAAVVVVVVVVAAVVAVVLRPRGLSAARELTRGQCPMGHGTRGRPVGHGARGRRPMGL